jgi:hypothetical protein
LQRKGETRIAAIKRGRRAAGSDVRRGSVDVGYLKRTLGRKTRPQEEEEAVTEPPGLSEQCQTRPDGQGIKSRSCGARNEYEAQSGQSKSKSKSKSKDSDAGIAARVRMEWLCRQEQNPKNTTDRQEPAK